MTSTFIPPSTVRNAGKTLRQSSWRIHTSKFPICNSAEIDGMTERLTIAPPEMIFGNNGVFLLHEPSGFEVRFTAEEALDRVDKTGEAGMLKVAYSKDWERMREKVKELEGIKERARVWDWTYSTDYSGGVEAKGKELQRDDNAQIPFDKLKRPDPILLFDEVMLYEDELADNGIAMLNVKVRVMPERLLVLQRFFLRLDDVVVRIRDTRVYVEFASGEVIREYVSREAPYEDVKKRFVMYPQDEIPAKMRDPNQLVEYLPVVETIREKTIVK